MTAARHWAGRHLLMAVALAVLCYLLAPSAVVMLMSFNDPVSKISYRFDGFTLNNWLNPCEPYGLCEALSVSIRISVLATIVATVLGTMIAFALVRHRFRGRGPVNLLVILPMAAPEIVLGSSILSMFIAAGLSGQLGFWTILVAHIMFCMSFVVVTVKARLTGMDDRLEEAAMDLYATPWQTFTRITLPLALPGIAAAALLSFSLSFDDFIITNLNSGTTVTFPMFVWGSARKAIPPQINVIGTIMFLLSLGAVIAGEWHTRRRARSVVGQNTRNAR